MSACLAMLTYYSDRRMNHLFPQGEKICVGAEGGRGDFIHLEYYDLINGTYQPRTLWIVEKEGKIPDIGDWIYRFPDIEAFHVSRDLVPFKKVNLENLKSFSLRTFQDENLICKYQEHLWLEDQVLPNVKFFYYFDHKISDLCGLNPYNLPNLEWLECHLDAKGTTLEAISEFKTLTALSITTVWKHDVFGAFNNQIKLLNLEGFSKGFPMMKISKQTNLEILRINSYKQEFDLEWLLDINLKELILLNCSKIINAEVLLKMKHLENLDILDCKKALSKELKSKLKEKGFNYLNIEYA